MKCILIFLVFINYLNSIELQKPIIYDKSKHSINGWYMSEKLDGIRAYWTGKELLSKSGNKIFAPSWFIKGLPPFEVDGELWTKRDDFENIQNIVLDKNPTSKWNEITYNIFEVPNQKGDFDKRLDVLKNWLNDNPSNFIKIIPQIVCKNKNHLNNYLNELINNKAEGIILKNPKKEYFVGRDENILKVKKFLDMEGLVIDHNLKYGEFKSLKVKLESGIIFNLGGGFSNEEKENPPSVGQTITFKYYGFTKYGKPKFASYLRVRKKE